MNTFVPRDWQSKAAEIVSANAMQGQTSALIYACPGSGKTLGGLLIASRIMSRMKKTDCLIVVTPNLAIKSQWIERAKVFGIHLAEIKDAKRLLDPMLPFGVHGYILNYQQAVNIRNPLRVFCERHAAIVILDEVHHTAATSEQRGGNAWGVAIQDAFRDASFVLCTTGTPFRQGNDPIAFVHYNDKGEATASTSYPLRDAIRDGVCRPIDFTFYDGAVEWTSRSGESVQHTFADALPKKLQRERLEAALSLEGDFPLRMLEEANEKLDDLRRGPGVDAQAGGLVVAIDTAHANALAAALERISGEAPVLVHSKIDDAQDLITSFNTGNQKWIVGVSMLSEGVDIPRLRVGVYATRIRAGLYFHQFCGRFSRVQESRRERSYVFLPRDLDLEAHVIEIDQEKFHALGEDKDDLGLRGVRHGRRGRRQALEVEDSESEIVAHVFAGKLITREEMEANRERIVSFRQKNAVYEYMTDGEIMMLMKSFGDFGRPAA